MLQRDTYQLACRGNNNGTAMNVTVIDVAEWLLCVLMSVCMLMSPRCACLVLTLPHCTYTAYGCVKNGAKTLSRRFAELIVCRNADFPQADVKKIAALFRDLELQRRRKGCDRNCPLPI